MRRSPPRLLLAFLLCLGAAAAPRPAHAEFKLGLEAVADFPLDVGVKLYTELPLIPIRLGVSAGIMPGAFIGTANSIAVREGLYDSATADLFTTSLTNALVVRARVGFRPLADRGLYLDFGYGYLAFGGGQSPSAALAAVSTVPVPSSSSANDNYTLKGKMQLLDVELGWAWNLTKSLTFRAALGFTFSFSSTQDITPGFTPKDTAAEGDYRQSAQQGLTSSSKIYTPVLSIAIGYQIL